MTTQSATDPLGIPGKYVPRDRQRPTETEQKPLKTIINYWKNLPIAVGKDEVGSSNLPSSSRESTVFGGKRWIAIYSATPPMAGKSSGGGLRDRSIGIQPPRLHHGRAASYGSIINPVMLSSPGREQSVLCRRFYRSPGSLRGLGAPTCAASAFGLHTGMYLMSVYSVFKVLGGRFALPDGLFLTQQKNR